MSQRLIQPGLSGMLHPHTHKPISPIGFRRNGQPIWPVLGAAPDDDTDTGGEDDKGDEGGDDDSDEEDESEDDEDDEKKKKKKKDDDEEEEEVVSKRKYDKLHGRMTAADRRASELQTKLDEMKNNADVPAEVKRELTEVKAALAEKDKTITGLTSARDNVLIKLEALTLKGAPVWENVEAALRLTDLEDVDVFDDGKVDKVALRAALKKTAKDHPYLVKKLEPKGDSGNETDASTATPMNRRKGKPQTADREALASRFPVLRQG
jgi:hypothetical protein